MAKEKIILTGDRPTGRLHIGHYVGSLRRRVELQNSGLYDKIFIFISTIWLADWTRRRVPSSSNPRYRNFAN